MGVAEDAAGSPWLLPVALHSKGGIFLIGHRKMGAICPSSHAVRNVTPQEDTSQVKSHSSSAGAESLRFLSNLRRSVIQVSTHS